MRGAKGTSVLTRSSYTYADAAGKDTVPRQTRTELNGDVTTYTLGALDRLS